MEEKERKEKSHAEEREKLLKQLNKYGGLWEDAKVEEKLQLFQRKKKICFEISVVLPPESHWIKMS